MTNEELLDEIGVLAEMLDSSLFGYQTMRGLPDTIHLEGLSGAMLETRDRLAKIYADNGGTETLNLDAKGV